MKKDIHPDYHDITVVLTNGKSFKTRSTWGKKGKSLKLDIDVTTHPAWTGGGLKLIDTGGQLKRFQKRFAGVGISSSFGGGDAKKSPPNNDAANDAAQNAHPEEAADTQAVAGQAEKPPQKPTQKDA